MKNKKVIAVISTDWHLKNENIDLVKYCVNEQIQLAKKYDVPIFCLGDIFDNRKSLSQKVLLAFKDILNMLEEAEIPLYAIVGNHDKAEAEERSSYLHVFEDNSFFTVFDACERVLLSLDEEDGDLLEIYCCAYMGDKVKEIIQDIKVNTQRKNLLLGHFSLSESTNLGVADKTSNLSVDDFRKFDLVLLGHYHDAQKVADNTYHIGSLYQANFGEDEFKGAILLYNDLTFEGVQFNTPTFKTIEVPVDKGGLSDLNLNMIEHEYNLLNADDKLKVKFTGHPENLNLVDYKQFLDKGIKVALNTLQADGITSESKDWTKKEDREQLFVRLADDVGIIKEIALQIYNEYL